MKKTLTAALAATMLFSVPASAQTMLLVIGERPSTPAASSHAATLDQKIETALDHVCEKPFFRDLKGQQLYKECRAEVRSEIEDQMDAAGESAAITVALR